MNDEVAIINRMLGISLPPPTAKALVAKHTSYDKHGHPKFHADKLAHSLKNSLSLLATNRAARELDTHRPVRIEEDVDDQQVDDAALPWGTVGSSSSSSSSSRQPAAATASSFVSTSNTASGSMSYCDKILKHIRAGILVKIKMMPNEDLQQNTFKLLSENRSPYLTPAQLKSACLYRLNVSLTDRQVAVVFQHLDPTNKGILNTRDLVDLILKEAYGSYKVTLDIVPSPPKIGEIRERSYVRNQGARCSYDHKFTGLHEPEPDVAIPVAALREVELKIFDKIFERTREGGNMYQLLVRCFSDGREKNDTGGITRDQMRYTLWKNFQLNVSNDVIDHLFRRYDRDGAGVIPLQRFCDAILTVGAQLEPLLEDPKMASESKYRPKRNDSDSSLGPQLHPDELNDFLKYLRRKFRDKINREGRAPHYLINCAERMTKAQAKQFFEQKFGARVTDGLLDELALLYNAKGLLNVKLLLHDVMVLPDAGKLGRDPDLLSGNTVTADEMPASLRGIRQTPEDIEALFTQKMVERLKNDQPMSHVHKVFKVGDTDGDVRYADRHTMRTVLSKFDIIPSDADFEQFFRKHLRRADGTIEIRALMVELLGENATHNPFLPKDKEAFDAQVNLAKAISGLAGTKIRNVSGMTGPAHTRLLLDGTDGEATEEAKSLLEMATTRQTKAVNVQGHFAATRVGLGTGLSPQPPAGSTSSRASSPRAAQPMQAHAHAHAAGPADADVNHHAPHVPRAPADGARGGKPRPVSAPPLMQTAQLDVTTQGHGQQGQQQARRSPRAAHVHYTPQVAVDGGRPNEEGIEDEGQGDGLGFDGLDDDWEDQLVRLQWEADNHGLAVNFSTNGTIPNDTVLSKDWGQFNLLQTGGSFAGQKKNVRPQTAAAHDTVALRRLPHAKAWKQTDAYQDLLKKKYKVTQKSAIQKSSQVYGSHFKELNRLISKEQQMKKKYAR